MPAEPAPEPARTADLSAGRDDDAPEGGATADDTAAAPPDRIAAGEDPDVPQRDPKAAQDPEGTESTESADTTDAPDPAPASEASGTTNAPTDTTPAPDSRAVRPRRGARGWTAAGAAVAVAAAITAGVLATGGGHHDTQPAARSAPSDGLRHTAVDVAPGSCGAGWSAAQKPRAGTQAFDLHNTGPNATEVYLKDPKTGRLFAELEGLAPGATRSMTVDLGSGRYAFECLQEDTDAVTGPTVTVPGKVPQGPSSLPVTVHDLIPPTLDYQKWIQARMAELSTDTGTLNSDIDHGNLAAARRDWLTGHLVYERMGAAYDTFGDADSVINGTTTLGTNPAADPGFTGFHRIEYGLWHD
ncbi:iron uptake system component EfeO, partial [Actinacidiphila yanglinensis]